MTPLAAAQSMAFFAWLDSASYAQPVLMGVADRRRTAPIAVLDELFCDGVLGAERCVPWLRTGVSAAAAVCAYTAILGGRSAVRQLQPELGRIQSGFVLNPAPDDKRRLAREFRDVVGSAFGCAANGVLDLARGETAALEPARVGVLAGTVHRGDREIVLSNGEFGVLTTLALRARSESTCDTLWPDREPDRARKLLKVYVHRIRSKAGAQDVVEATAREYRLGPGVHVDVDDAEAILRRRHPDGRLEFDDMRLLERAFADFRSGGYRRLSDLDNYAALERRIYRVGGDIAQALAGDAWSRGQFARALRIAEEMLDSDPCGEVGIELTVRAQLALGNRDAAGRRFRDYARILREELDCVPPHHIATMLDTRASVV